MGPEDNEGSFGGQRDVGPDVGPTRECPSQRPSGAEVGGVAVPRHSDSWNFPAFSWSAGEV